MEAALRCLGLVCTKLSSAPGAPEGAGTPLDAQSGALGPIGAPVGAVGLVTPAGLLGQSDGALLKLMLLLPGASVGRVVGKGGIGLKLMREKHGVTIDSRHGHKCQIYIWRRFWRSLGFPHRPHPIYIYCFDRVIYILLRPRHITHGLNDRLADWLAD